MSGREPDSDDPFDDDDWGAEAEGRYKLPAPALRAPGTSPPPRQRRVMPTFPTRRQLREHGGTPREIMKVITLEESCALNGDLLLMLMRGWPRDEPLAPDLVSGLLRARAPWRAPRVEQPGDALYPAPEQLTAADGNSCGNREPVRGNKPPLAKQQLQAWTATWVGRPENTDFKEDGLIRAVRTAHPDYHIPRQAIRDAVKLVCGRRSRGPKPIRR